MYVFTYTTQTFWAETVIGGMYICMPTGEKDKPKWERSTEGEGGTGGSHALIFTVDLMYTHPIFRSTVHTACTYIHTYSETCLKDHLIIVTTHCRLVHGPHQGYKSTSLIGSSVYKDFIP